MGVEIWLPSLVFFNFGLSVYVLIKGVGRLWCLVVLSGFDQGNGESFSCSCFRLCHVNKLKGHM